MSVLDAGARALVTGATGGLGRAIARALHARGATVVATGRRQEALDELVGELGGRVEPLVADLADRGAVADLPDRAGRVDVLVANAALPGSGALDTFAPKEIDRALDVNLRAPMQLARALAPAMGERGRGHLVFVSSLNGKIAAGGASVYTATKYGMRGFAASLRAELGEGGIGVSAVFPGFVSGAGMWAEDVAAAVVRAIVDDRGEIDVAPAPLRLSAGRAGVWPGIIAGVGRRLGADRVAEQAAAAQRSKR